MAISESKKKVSLRSPFAINSEKTLVKHNHSSPSPSVRPRTPRYQPSSGIKRAGSPDNESVISKSISSDWKSPRDVTKYPRYEVQTEIRRRTQGLRTKSAIQRKIILELPKSADTNHTGREADPNFTPLRPRCFTSASPTRDVDGQSEKASLDGGSGQEWESERDKSWRRQVGLYQMSSLKHANSLSNGSGSVEQISSGSNGIIESELQGNVQNGDLVKAENDEQDNAFMQNDTKISRDGLTDDQKLETKPSISHMTEVNQVDPVYKTSKSVQPTNFELISSRSRGIKEASLDATAVLDFSKLSIEDRTPKASSYRQSRVTHLTRAAQRKIELEKEKDQYRITPLSKEWDMKVRHAVRNGHDQLSATDFARVVPEYSTARNQDNWLNDEVVNSYLTLIVQHGKKEDRKDQVASHHAFNSFLYKNLSEKGYQSVRRWANRAKIGGKNLLETEKVFIPINQGMHWTLAVVEAQKRTISIYNSMGTSRGVEVATKLLQYVKEEVGATFEDSEWSIKPDGATPQQQNSDDCGVFTITNARQIMLGKMPMDSYQTSDIPTQRRRIVAELINGGLLKSGA